MTKVKRPFVPFLTLLLLMAAGLFFSNHRNLSRKMVAKISAVESSMEDAPIHCIGENPQMPGDASCFLDPPAGYGWFNWKYGETITVLGKPYTLTR
jgi:hypothetical protein